MTGFSRDFNDSNSLVYELPESFEDWLVFEFVTLEYLANFGEDIIGNDNLNVFEYKLVDEVSGYTSMGESGNKNVSVKNDF